MQYRNFGAVPKSEAEKDNESQFLADNDANLGTAKNLTRSAWWQMSDLKHISSEVRFKLDDAGRQAEKGTLKRQADAVRVGVMSAFLFLIGL